MKQQILQSGSIICSTIVLSGLVHTATEQALTAQGESATDNINSPNSASKTEKHRVKTASLLIGLPLPDRLIPLQWGKQRADQLPKTMEAVYAKQLNQAQALAKRDEFMPAVSMVAAIPRNSRYYPMAQQLQEDWSQELLQRATDQWQQAQMRPAMAMIAAIPPGSQSYDRALELRRRWQQQATRFERAIVAARAKDWQGVVNAVNTLEGSTLYNSLSVQNLLQEAMTRLYEPDQRLFQIATDDLPMVQPGAIAIPETIATPGNR